MSTSRSCPSLPRVKKLSSRVRPGVTDTRARLVRPVSALIRLDLPTLERPAKQISGLPSVGRPSILTTPLTKLHPPLNSASPRAISAFENSASIVEVMAMLHPRRHARTCSGHPIEPCNPQRQSPLDRRDKPGDDASE